MFLWKNCQLIVAPRKFDVLKKKYLREKGIFEENYTSFKNIVGGAVASWLVRSIPEGAVQVRSLGGDIVLCLGQDTLLSQCLSPPGCINRHCQIVGENLRNCGEVTCDGLASRPGKEEILLAASCYRNQDKLRQI